MSVGDAAVSADIKAGRRVSVTMALVALVVLLVLISLGTGPVRLSPLAVIEALFGGGSDVSQVIVRERGGAGPVSGPPPRDCGTAVPVAHSLKVPACSSRPPRPCR